MHSSQAAKLAKCSRLLDSIYKSVKSELFRAPVDWKTLNLLDYPRIVTTPMVRNSRIPQYE